MTYEYLTPIFEKQVVEDIDRFEPFVFNRFISMIDKKYLIFAQTMDKYVFSIDKEKLYDMYYNLIPKQKTPFIEFIKTNKDIETEYDFLFEEIKKYYQIGDTEIQKQKIIFIKLFENKEILREYLRFFGCEKKYYDNFGLNMKQEKAKEVENKWF